MSLSCLKVLSSGINIMLTVINVFDQIYQVVSVSGVDVNPDQNRVSSDQTLIKIVLAVIKCVNSLTTASTEELSGYWENIAPLLTISLAWFRRSGSLWERLVM